MVRHFDSVRHHHSFLMGQQKCLSPTLQGLAGYAMGQYALGYFTPPGAPGEGPEVVPPQYALGITESHSTMGGVGDLEALEKALST